MDLCGEPAWMRRMIDAHEAQAKASGARIVFSCGFDSIPFDLGVFLLQSEMRARFGQPASPRARPVRKMKGTFSGGTAASLKGHAGRRRQRAGRARPAARPVCAHARLHRPAPALGQQAHGGRGARRRRLGRALCHGGHQHAQCAPLKLPAGPRLRSRFRLRRDAGHRPRRKGEAIANAVAADKSLGSDSGPSPARAPRAEREAGFTTCCSSARPRQATACAWP